MKQTVVEWLYEVFYGTETFNQKEVLKQAKEMEKEQMENFFKAGVNYGAGSVFSTEYGEDTTEPNFEQYYNETFGK